MDEMQYKLLAGFGYTLAALPGFLLAGTFTAGFGVTAGISAIGLSALAGYLVGRFNDVSAPERAPEAPPSRATYLTALFTGAAAVAGMAIGLYCDEPLNSENRSTAIFEQSDIRLCETALPEIGFSISKSTPSL